MNEEMLKEQMLDERKGQFLSQFESFEEFIYWWSKNIVKPVRPPHPVGTYPKLRKYE